MNKTDWQRRSALFDEAVDLPESTREAWLKELAVREPRHVEAVTRMLADYVRDTDSAEAQPRKSLSLMGVAAREFEAKLEAATGDDLRLQPGVEVGAWRLKEKIGEGGMGAVWMAERHDGNYEGRAAIKFLRTGLGKTEVLERFLRERRLLARLQHPNIARLLDAGAYQGEPYLVMEYVDGDAITHWAAAHAPTVTGRVALILKVCRAVENAHGQLIVHRDLKPSNVLVGGNGEPALLDFGIAKLIDDEDEEYGTALTRMTGRGYTLGYCAPEQITGEPTGVAADVFSIGVLLFEMLSGTLPFKPEHEGRQALEHAIVHTDARSLGRALDNPDSQAAMNRPRDADHARGDLEAIVGKSLRKNPADRYATVSALADDLDRWLSSMPVLARRGNWQYMTMLWLKRNRALATVATIAFVAVTAGMVTALWQAERANDEARRADQEKISAVEQRRRAEIATSQATAALAESERAKSLALEAQSLADGSARSARESATLAIRNELRSREAEASAAAAGRQAQLEAVKARAVNKYLVTLFESADPEHTKGEKLTAREVLDTGTKSLSAQFANDPDTLAELQGALGQSYVGLSQPQTAIPLLKAALAHAARRNGPQSVEHARLEFSLARAQTETENFPESEKHFRASLAVLEPIDGAASESIVIGKINLAYAMQKQGKYAEVEALIMPVRAAIIAQRGEKDWLFAEIENARAVLYSAQGKVKDEQATLLNIEPLLYSPPPNKRSDALTIRNNLAISLGRSGNLPESIRRTDGVLEGFASHIGPEAELTMKVHWFAGDLRRQAGRYAECASQYEKLATLRVKVSGETHPLTVDVFSKLASCAQLAGNEVLAGKYLARALAALPASDTPPQRTVLRTLMTLQFVALDRSEAQEAPAMLPRAKALAAALNLAQATPENMWMIAVGASAASRAGDSKAALGTMDDIVAKVPAFANVPSVRAWRAYLMMLDGQFERAKADMQEVRKLVKLRYPDEHPLHIVLDYVDALAARSGDATAAIAAHQLLEKTAGRKARLPLAPNWFGL